MATRYSTKAAPPHPCGFVFRNPSPNKLLTPLSTEHAGFCIFVWDEAKYPTISPLKEIVDGIHLQIAKIEDDLKVCIAEYSNMRSLLNSINRKQAGRCSTGDPSIFNKLLETCNGAVKSTTLSMSICFLILFGGIASTNIRLII